MLWVWPKLPLDTPLGPKLDSFNPSSKKIPELFFGQWCLRTLLFCCFSLNHTWENKETEKIWTDRACVDRDNLTHDPQPLPIGAGQRSTRYRAVAMAWQPADGPLKQLAGFLSESLNSKDPAAQKHAEQVRRDLWVAFSRSSSSAQLAWPWGLRYLICRLLLA